MFKVSDKVIIRYHTQEEKDNYEDNWDYWNAANWHPYMDGMEGKIYEIDEIVTHGYRIADERGTWRFAKTSLVPVYDQF